MGDVIGLRDTTPRPAPSGSPGHQTAPCVAVIVPTLNERDNVTPLIDALDDVLIGLDAEIIFVDDWSTDGTAAVIEAIAQRRRDVRLIRRHGRRGLASAAIEGVLATTAEIVAVIDADLQHDERILPAMIRAILTDRADIAIGSRYVGNGSCGSLADDRKRISRLATNMANGMLRLDVADPLSGFFAVRREIVVDLAPRLSGRGFKILLDILATASTPLRTAEIPYAFRTRTAGASKLDASVAADYVHLVAAKLVQRLLASHLVMFGLVGLLGMVLNLAILRAGLAWLSFATAQALAVTITIACNFLLNNRFTYRARALRGFGLIGGLASFYLVCGLGALANVGISAELYLSNHIWWLSSFAGMIVGSGWNFLASSALTWRRPVHRPE